MRPDPRDISTLLKAKTTLKPWKSMPLPTSTSKAVSASNRSTPIVGRRNRKTRRFSGRRTSIASSLRSLQPLPDVEERADRISIERVSIASHQIDGFKMLYKTDERTDNVLDMTSKLWKFEPKKANKNWFLGNIHHTKTETPPNEIVIPRRIKPYTSVIRTVQRQVIRKPIIVESIVEEDEGK